MSDLTSPALPARRAEIDLAALRHNAAWVRGRLAPGVHMMAMVKANGYGHDAVLCARAFVQAGADWLGVSSAAEALQLRAAGLTTPILNVNWSEPASIAALIAAEVELTCWDLPGAAAIAAGARQAGRRARVQVKVDTGLGRLGAQPEHVEGVLEALLAGERVEVRGVFTHYADADGADLAFSEQQHRRFLEVAEPLRARLPGLMLHSANSAATLRLPHMHHDLVRPGIVLYGYAPVLGLGEATLRPAMRLVAPVTQVKIVRRGGTVGYGRTWRAAQDTRVATVGAGYADGVHRALSNRGTVLVAGRRCPMIGRVSMDQIGVDVSAVPGEVVPGDECVLFGEQRGQVLGAAEVAAGIGTISYELLCAVSARVPRVAV